MFTTMIALVILHFLGDFVLQSRTIANSKGKDVKVMLIHCGIYAVTFIFMQSLLAMMVLFTTHFVIDTVTSKYTSRFYKNDNMYGFFTTVGLDQMLHMLVLIFVASGLSGG